jgi:lipoyl(octanoyl) transferase
VTEPAARPLHVHWLGRVDYADSWSAMRAFTDERGPDTPDALWLLEHPPVFTQGLAGKAEHVLAAGDIPVVQTDRGGQVTYHGPGQLVAYPLLDLDRLGLGVRCLVHELEETVIRQLANYGLAGERKDGAPGVYIDGAKIASIGLKVRRGCTYHGLSFNVDLDLAPFGRINPCGYAGQAMTRLADLRPEVSLQRVGDEFVAGLGERLGLDCRAAAPDDDPHASLSGIR